MAVDDEAEAEEKGDKAVDDEAKKMIAEAEDRVAKAWVPFDIKLEIVDGEKSLQNVPKLPQITPEVPKIMNLGRTNFFTGPHQKNFFTVTVPFSTKRELVSFKGLS